MKWSIPGNGVALSRTSRCSSYRKWSLRVTVDWKRQLYYLRELCFVCVDTEASVTCCPFQTMQQVIGLDGCICQKRYIISVVHVRNRSCSVSSAFCFWQNKPFSILAAMEVRLVIVSSQVNSLRKGRVQPFVHLFVYMFGFLRHFGIRTICRKISLFSTLPGVIH